MHADSDRLNDLSGRVIGCAFIVLNTLGAGFMEKVYENALAHELCAGGLAVAQQCSVRVHYKDVVVGEYFADLWVEGVLLVELKTVKALEDTQKIEGSVRISVCEAFSVLPPIGRVTVSRQWPTRQARIVG